MRRRLYHFAIIALILNTVIWSAASPIIKWSLADAPPFALAFFRFIIATVILFPFAFKHIKVKFDDLHKIFILSLAGITLHIVLYYLGLELTPSINSPIISSMTPLFLILCAMVFLKEKPKTKVLIGTMIGFFGVLIIIIRPLLEHSSIGSLLGNLYLVLSVMAIVAYTILLKKYKLPYPFITLLFWMFLMGSLTLFPMYLVELQTSHAWILNERSLIGILYGAVFSSTLGYLFYNYGVRYIKANEIGIFSYMEPVITALVAIPLLGEKITFTYLLGSLFVFIGIIIAEGRLHYHPTRVLKEDHLHPSKIKV